MKGFWSLAITTAFMTSAAIFPPTAQAQITLGGIDIDKYCKDRFGRAGIAARAELVENTAWGWRCRVGRDLVSLSLDNACRFQYENQSAYSKARDSGNPYSWICLATKR